LPALLVPSLEDVPMVDVLGVVGLVLVALLYLGLVLVFVACMAWVLYAVVALIRGRRPTTNYGRQLRARERNRHRRSRRRGRYAGITIFLDLLPPGLGKREP
jgi:hypothetical protein